MRKNDSILNAVKATTIKNILRGNKFSLGFKFLGILFLVLLLSGKIMGQVLLTENFSYTTGTALTGQGSWANASGAGTNNLTVSGSGLTYAGSTMSGIGLSLPMTTNGEDDVKLLSSSVSSGSVYASFLIKVSAAATGDHSIGLSTGTTGSPGFAARVYIKSTTGGFYFGCSKGSATTTYETGTARTTGTTYLVVVKYTYNTGNSTDDVVSLWVNPSLGATEGTALITTGAGSTDNATITGFYLRQGTAGSSPTQEVDGILVGTTWASVTPSNSVTITYDSNGSTSGTAPSDASSPYTAGSTVTVKTNSGALAKTGYTFAGWNTASNGGGTDYAASGSATFTINSNTTLYAKWTANNNTITFNGNGSTGGSTTSQSLATANSANLTANGYTKSGYSFAGWNTAANGSGTNFANQANYTMGTGDVTLYAKWTANNNTITFNGNGSTGGSMSNQTIATDASANLTTNTYTNTGYNFTGWNTASDGTGISYADGVSYTMGTANVTLYAIWSVISTPTILKAGSLSAVSTIYGTASSTTTFTVSGSALTHDIIITPPAGFEVSTSSGSGFANTLTLSPSSGTVASTTIYVRLKATAAATSYSGNIALTSTDATEVDLATVSSTVSPKPLTIIGLSTTDKPYDGTTMVTVSGTPAYSGLVNGETPSVTGTVSWAFADATASNNKTLTRTGSYDVPTTNYTLTQPSLTATISKVALTITAGNQSVSYGTAVAAVTSAGSYTASGFVNSENATVIGGSATYSTTYTITTAVGTAGVTITPIVTSLTATNYSFTAATGSLTIIKANQIITLSSTATKYVGDADYTLAATSATSGINLLSYSSSNTNVASIDASTGLVHIKIVGTTILTVSQGGSTNYNAATDATQTLTVNPTPVISILPTSFASFSTTTGTAGVAQAFTVSATNLADNITVTPPSGFEISQTSATSGFATSQVVTHTGGVVSNALVYVRFSSVAAAGTYSGNITLTSPSATTINVAVSGRVNYVCSTLPIHTGTLLQSGWTEASLAQGSSSSNDYLQMLSSISKVTTPVMNFNAFSGLKLDFKARTYSSATTAQATITISISVNNGGSYSQITTVVPANNTMTAQTQIDLSSYSGSQVFIKFETLGAGSSKGVGIDDITISGTCNAVPAIIPGGGPISILSTTYNTPSSYTSFTLSGSGLGTTISIDALSGYEFSTLAGGTYTSTLSSISATGPTTIYVRLAASANVGSYNGNIHCSSGATTLDIPMTTGTINKANPTLTVSNTPVNYDGTAKSASATASGGGTVSNISTGGAASQTVAGTYSVIADIAASSNYNAATGVTATNSFIINKATPSLSVTNTPTYTGSPIAATVTGSVAGTVSNILYAGSATVPTNVGTYAITADFVPADGTNYSSLTAASAGSFIINKATPTVSVPVGSYTYNGSAQGPNAVTTASTGTLTYSYVSTDGTTYPANAARPSAAGNYTVTASVAADANYNTASSIATAFTIAQAPQTITFGSLSSKFVGDADYNPGATSVTSGTNPITYTSSVETVATIVSGQIHIVGAGTTTITASQAGSANYNAASDATQDLTVSVRSVVTINSSATSTALTDPTANVTVTSTGDLTVDADKTVHNITVAPGGKLTLADTKTLSGTITLQSSSSATGTFVDNNAGTPPVITGTVEQYLPQGRNWYIGSPVTGVNSSTLKGSGIASSVVYYNESSSSWSTDFSGTLIQGKGYIAVSSPADGSATNNVSFSGTLNTGDVPVTLTRQGSTKAGFNLVANPYPSYLDWSKADTATSKIMSTVWYRTKTSGGAYTFDTYNGNLNVATTLGATKVTNLIPPMQAFWVRVKEGNATSTLTFTNAMRAHADDVLNKFKVKSQTANALLRLDVTNGTNKDETIICFTPNASNSFDAYDSQKMSNASASIPEIYTLAGNEQLVINGMTSVPYDSEIPLGFTTGQAGTNFSIVASQISNFDPGTQIILKDYADTSYPVIADLSDGSSYTFSSGITSNNTSRFSLIFRAPSVTTGMNRNSGNGVWISTDANGQLRINGNVTGETSIVICNAIGQKLFSKNLTSNTSYPEIRLTPGVYAVTLTNAGKNSTTKVVIK